MPLPIKRQPTRRRPPNPPPPAQSAAQPAKCPQRRTLYTFPDPLCICQPNDNIAIQPTSARRSLSPNSLVISRISLAISRSTLIPAPLRQCSPSPHENLQESSSSRLRQFASFSRRSLVISCTSLIQHPYQQSRPHTDLFLSWPFVIKGVLRGPSWPFVDKKRFSSRPSSTKTVFFAALRGLSWTKKVFLVALMDQNSILRGPSWPLVALRGQKGCSSPPSAAHPRAIAKITKD